MIMTEKTPPESLTLPTKEEALQIMRQLGLRGNIVKHEQSVMRKARNMAHNITTVPVNMELVKIGALMHDIGRTKTHDMDHGIVGGAILRDMGFSIELARIAEVHSMAGLTAAEAKQFGLPAKDYLPETIEEKLVCLADKYFIGTKEVTIDERFGRWITKYGETEFLLAQVRRAKILEEYVLRQIFN